MMNIYWVLALCWHCFKGLACINSFNLYKTLKEDIINELILLMKNKAEICPVIWTSNTGCKCWSQDLTPEPVLQTTTHIDYSVIITELN